MSSCCTHVWLKQLQHKLVKMLSDRYIRWKTILMSSFIFQIHIYRHLIFPRLTTHWCERLGSKSFLWGQTLLSFHIPFHPNSAHLWSTPVFQSNANVVYLFFFSCFINLCWFHSSGWFPTGPIINRTKTMDLFLTLRSPRPHLFPTQFLFLSLICMHVFFLALPLNLKSWHYP